MIKCAYFGTPELSALLLEKLIIARDLPIKLKLVVTQEDKIVGRKKILQPTPVKILAEKYNLPLWNKSLKDLSCFLQETDIDLCILFAFGKIIKNDLLKSPKYDFWNIHPSALPHLRGPSPITYSILLNEPNIKVSLMQMDNLVDHGKIISYSEALNINLCSKKIIETKIVEASFLLIKHKINDFLSSQQSKTKLNLIEQNHNLATFTRKITKQDGFIPLEEIKKSLLDKNYSDYLPEIISEFITENPNYKFISRSSQELICNMYRAFQPWPGIWTEILHKGKAKRLKIIEILTKNGSPEITKVQLDGKNIVDMKTFNDAYHII